MNGRIRVAEQLRFVEEKLTTVRRQRTGGMDEPYLEAIRETLLFCQHHRDGFVAWMQQKRVAAGVVAPLHEEPGEGLGEGPGEELRDDVLGHPAVKAVLKEFPGAEVVAVREISDAP